MSVPEPISGGQFPPEVKALHGQLSPAAAAFLEFTERVPEALSRHNFKPHEASPFITYALHAWPTFVEGPVARQMREVAPALCRLIKRAPRRLLGATDRAAAFYGLPHERAHAALDALARTDDARGAIGRGDFIHDGTAFKCVEFNLTAGVGGWETAIHVQQVLAQPAMQRFAMEQRLRVRQPRTLRDFFSNVVDTVRRDLDWEGECNIGILFSPSTMPEAGPAEQVSRFFTAQLQELLQPEGARGEVLLAAYGSVESEAGAHLTLRGKRLHAVVEYDARDRQAMAGATYVAQAQAAFDARTVSLLNGPAQDVLDDKRNLALLWEHVTSPALSEAEQELVRRNVPWSCRVERTHVERDGARYLIPELLASQRESLVLKPGRDYGGESVLVGGTTSAAEWDTAVRKALDVGGWVVQERVQPMPLHALGPEGTVVPHIAVWGLFVLGETYGGHFLRMCPMRRGTGVVNVAQGAIVGALIELE
ncbi:circularly permuted type 2 ATP-grasp protein [Myxococcus sp. AB056]|uniref:circularly permuted type 2 ATP-grasp protein n=1 Tax=Myxococcus sp. AB056 TaxID=2562792 RepID=UPI001146E650|nr:circularly permuted type 2 ATP-grasp protein [Myxococcus sp. AB056]